MPLFDFEKRVQLYSLNSISEQMPISFKKGGHVFKEVSGKCGSCGSEIEDERLRGEVDNSFKDVAVVRAVGTCLACNTSTCFMFKFYADSRFSIYGKNGWRNVKIKQPDTYKTTLKKISQLLFPFIKH